MADWLQDTRATSPISDVWSEVIIAAGLSTGAAVALGFSRFAYGLLLPAMRADLGWTYVEAGALNTAIGAGYILGALIAAWTARRWGMARAFLSGFVASVVVLLLTAATSNFSVLFALRTIGGISRAGNGLRYCHAGRAAGASLSRSDRDVRLCGPVRGQLHGRPDIDHHRGAAPIAGRVMDRSPLAPDRCLRVGTGRRPDSRGCDFRRDGKSCRRLLGVAGSAGGCRLCEPAATTAGGERNLSKSNHHHHSGGKPMTDRKGGCLCGAVRYVLKGEPRSIAICHCTHCQRQSGSLFSFNLVLRESDYEQSGETMIYVDSGDSGHPVYRHFCGRCGSPISVQTALIPGKVVLKAGTLDNMEGLQPKAEIYTDHAVAWLAPVAGAHRHPQNV